MATGTKVADVYVDLGLALTQFRKDLAKAKSEAGSIGAQIRTALNQPAGGTGTYTSGIARMIQDFKSGHSAMQAFRANLPALGRDLAKLSVAGLHASLNGLQSVGQRVFGGLRNLAGNVFKGLAVGAGIAGFLSIEKVIERVTAAIPDLINKGKEWAEAIHTITLETGATTEVASKQAAIYKFLGGSTDQYATQVVRLSARIKANEDTLIKYGVVTRNTNGDFLDTITIADNMRKVFSLLPDGVDKTGIAFKLFGQRGAQAFGPLIHFLGLTDEQVKVLGEDVESQGLVITDAQTKLADSVEKAQNRVSNAITGLATNLFTVLGPAMVQFFDSLAQAVVKNGQQIVDTLGAMSTAVLGFIEGLIGVPPAVESFSSQFPRINEGGANTSATLITLQDELDKLKGKLNPAADSAARFNAGIEAQTKALDREGEAIDKQIAKLKKIGDAQEAQFRRGLSALERTLDLETQLLDAEDERASRADQDLAQTRALREAKVALFEAQAQLRKDTLEPGGDAAAAQAQRDKDVLDIAKAQQAVLDAQKAITDEASSRARDDRREQLAGVRDYVEGVQKIVSDSENQKAALKNLTTRKSALESAIAAATEKGDAQAVADLKLKLAAVDQGITEETAKIKQTAAIDELTARKKQLDDMKEALRSERQSEAAINRHATQIAIDAKEAEIQKEKDRIKASRENRRLEIKDAKLFSDAISGPEGVTSAFEDARVAGQKFGTDMQKALVGDPPGSGGVLGAIGSVAEAIGHIFDGLTSAWNAIPKELRGIVVGALAGGAVGGLPGAAIGALTGGAIQLGAVNAGTDAQKKALVEQTITFAKTASLDDLQTTWRALIAEREKRKTVFGTETQTSAFIAQLVEILGKAIANRFAGPTPHAAGGWVGMRGPELGMFGEKGREYVLDHALSEKLDAFFSGPQVPVMAPSGFSGQPVHLHFNLDGKKWLDFTDKNLGWRTGR